MDVAVGELKAEAVAAFRRNGWLLVPGLINKKVAAELRDKVENHMGRDLDRSFRGAGTGDPKHASLRAASEVYESPSLDEALFNECATSSELGGLASQLCGGRPMRLYHDAAQVKRAAVGDKKNGLLSGTKETPWHQDLPYMPFDRGDVVTIWIALTDISPDMGSLRFLSGSHRCGPLGRAFEFDLMARNPWLNEEYELSPPLELAMGDATIHDGLVVHSAGENMVPEPRWVYKVLYFPKDALYTGAAASYTDDLGLTVNREFDHHRFPVVK
jgi:hypothetical protein